MLSNCGIEEHSSEGQYAKGYQDRFILLEFRILSLAILSDNVMVVLRGAYLEAR